MDQLKVFWAVVVKYHFWILMVVVLLGSIGSFYVSRQAIDQQVATQTSQLKNVYQKVSTLSGSAGTHPNPFSDEEMKKSVSLMTGDVKSAWESQYNRQRSILVWPEEVGKAETLKTLNSFRPIEFFLEYTAPPTPAKPEPLNLTEREVYRDYVKDVFPKLAKIVGSNWTATMKATGGVGGVGGAGGAGYDAAFSGGGSSPAAAVATIESAPLVVWSTESQSTLQGQIVPWYNPDSPPSTLEICYTQEDLWVLDGVLRVIKRTNGNARENFQAPIKEIQWIRLGKTARADAGSVMGVAALSAPTMASPSASYGPSNPVAGPPAAYGGGANAVRADPADGRYVDSDYKPVPSSKLRSAMRSSAPSDALFAVAKRIPVQFRLKMDPTKIATLIAECGNNAILIEVKQVRINGRDGGSGGDGGGEASGGASSVAGAYGGGGGGNNGPPGAGGNANSGSSSELASDPAAKSGDVPVEIYGIVYLFNPVDIQKLGLDKITSDTELATTVEGDQQKAGGVPAVPGNAGVPPIGPAVNPPNGIPGNQQNGQGPPVNPPIAPSPPIVAPPPVAAVP